MKQKTIRLLVLLFVVMSPIALKAQWNVGIQGGYTFNTISTSSSYQYDRNYRGQNGFAVSATGGYEFNKWFTLQADLGVMQKNYKMFRASNSFSKEHAYHTNTYLQLPIYSQFSFGGTRLRGFTNLGGYIGYWADGRIKGETMANNFGNNLVFRPFDQGYEFNSIRDNRFEAGLLAGVGVSYLLDCGVKIFGEARYLYSLTDMQKSYMINQMPRYNNTVVIQVGCTFNFTKK